MKKLMLLAAGLAASIAIASIVSACGGSAPTLTFAQQVSIACGAANGEIAILKADNVFTGGALDTLNNTVQPDLNKVCAVGATVTVANLQNIVNATLPLVKSIVDTSTLAQNDKNVADAAIDSGVLAFNIAIQLIPASTATPASGASAAAPASAPAAASSTILAAAAFK